MFHSWQLNNITNINTFSQRKCFSKNATILENVAFEKEVKKRGIIYMADIKGNNKNHSYFYGQQ